jgi:tRNA dimethylallyltransferase
MSRAEPCTQYFPAPSSAALLRRATLGTMEEKLQDAQSAGRGRIGVGFIVGPTGAGKSALAMAIAGRLNCEIINADSRQFYRGMDVGTAKPSAQDRVRVPHHLIDVREAGEPLDVAEFGVLARAAIADVAGRGRNPLVVGGSGLYLRVIRGGIFRGPAASAEIRERLAKVAAERGVEHLHQKLREIDPEAANRIGVNDLYRIIRALEVFELTGETISAHQARHRFTDIGYDTLTVGVEVERQQLYEAIERRFDAMMAAGLVEEVRALLGAGHSPEKAALSTIGYKQIAAYLRGETALAGAVASAKQESRRLAKRQLTWFRREREMVWLDSERGADDALALFGKFFARE